MRGGAIQGPDPGTIDLSADRKPLPLLLNEHQVSVCSVKGLRSFMEDEFVSTGDYCAVFDGHGGDAVSRFLRQNLYAFMQAALPSKLAGSGCTGSSTQSDATRNFLPTSAGRASEVKERGPPLSSSVSSPEAHESNDFDPPHLKWVPTVEDYVIATHSAFEAVDAKVQRILHWSFQGSTATGVWLHDDGNGTRHVVTGHVGDSRAVLSRLGGSQIIELSRDHKPDRDEERARIESVGGSVIWCGRVDRDGRPIPGTGLYRVNGNLALSRAIGDRSERPAVTARPDISVQALTPDDDFLVLATDGLWDVMSTVDVVGFVQALIDEDDGELMADRDLFAAKLVEEALRRGTYDNVTVIIVWLDSISTGSI
jgi:serine/threonine protein phosphatase PrpC